MEVVEQVKEHDVVDFDFMFASGSKLAVTLDETAGDTYDENPNSYVLNVVAKPSLSDPDEKVEPETIEVYKAHLAVSVIRQRKQRTPSEEEQFNMRKTIHALAKRVQ